MCSYCFAGDLDGLPARGVPLASWMAEALKKYPKDCEALARVAVGADRAEAFVSLRDYRERGYEICLLMRDRAYCALSVGVSVLDGPSLLGAVWLDEENQNGPAMSSETAGFYVYVLKRVYCDLAPFLVIEGRAARALGNAGWKP